MAVVAIAGSIFRFAITLYQQADTKLLQTAPTLAAADFRYSAVQSDGTVGALTALDNTPTVDPAGGAQVVVVLSAAETAEAGAGGFISVIWQDAAGAEWCSGSCIVPVWSVEPAGVGDAMTLGSGAITAAVVATGAIDSDALAVSAVNDIADRVWDEPLVAHLGVGSTGEALDAAAAGGAGLTAAQVWSYASRTLTGFPAGITYTGPVADGGDVVTYRGDTYLNEDGRALEWESDDWPDLAGASIAVIIDRTVSLAGSVVAASGPGIVRLELTSTQSASITPGRHLFQIVATQADADVATLVEASWVSRKRAAV